MRDERLRYFPLAGSERIEVFDLEIGRDATRTATRSPTASPLSLSATVRHHSPEGKEGAQEPILVGSADGLLLVLRHHRHRARVRDTGGVF